MIRRFAEIETVIIILIPLGVLKFIFTFDIDAHYNQVVYRFH